MIGYLYTLAGVLAGSTKGAVSKKISGSIHTLRDNLLINGLRMIFCALIGFAAILITGNLSSMGIGFREGAICLLSACSFSAFVLLWMVCVKGGALVLIDVFLTAGVILPMVGGLLFLDETVSLRQWCGFPVLLIGVLFLCSYSSRVSTKLTKKQVLLLILCGAANGVSSLSQKLFTHCCPGVHTLIFNFYTYLFSIPIFLVLFLLTKRPVQSLPRQKLLTLRLLGSIIAISLCLYCNLLFKTLAGLTLSTARIYPLCQGLGIINSALIASIFFGEPLRRKSVIGILISIGALLMINL